jgi:hypothetical protein
MNSGKNALRLGQVFLNLFGFGNRTTVIGRWRYERGETGV